MINYARERAIEVLQNASATVLATVGLSGVQASEYPCEAVGLNLYLILPMTSDHLFNLEQDNRVALHTDRWELTGRGEALFSRKTWPQISILPKTEMTLYVLVKVVPDKIQVLRSEGWGPAETIDVSPLE